MIATDSALALLIPELQAAECVGLDTEADSLHAYPEKLCLLQLSFVGQDLLVDPLAGCDFRPILAALRDRYLVLHGADYDLRLLHHAFGFVPSRIFDTMWAARLLGYREFGLSHLVQQLLGVTLEKGPQKMNWALRPLPERMVTYALNDTRYLQPLAALLRSRLLEEGRLSWLEEVCSKVIRESSTRRKPDPEALWRIKGSDRLEPSAMAVLRELWHWRELEAVSANKPPYFVLSHEKLVALSAAAARGKPTDTLIPRHLPAQRSARLNAALERGATIAPAHYPQRRRPQGVRLTPIQQGCFDELKRVRDARAAELDLDPTVIASKSELILLVNDGATRKCGIMKWQRALLQEA